jgi:16S rRNA (guanine(966)-N(2))-methyltransferase RsmD
MLRIITGKHKGKKLLSLEGENTRPTSDRIKGAMFSSIQFDIENRRVLDLFAGTGQLGLEALSRGAESVTFVDAERDAIDVVKANCKALGEFEKCRYAVSDWRNFIRKASGRDTYDLVFIDPPYSLECSLEALRLLVERELIIKGALIVIESGTEDVSSAALLEDFELLKQTPYGKKTTLTVLLYK